MPGVPFTFQSASWSDPLGLVPGALPASPTNVAAGSTALLQAASMSGIASHATLIAGRWPVPPTAGVSRAGGVAAAIPAALPASAAKLLHVSIGDVLRLRDRVNNALVSFDITGVFAARAASGPDDSYWALSYIPAKRSVRQLHLQHLRPAGGEPGRLRAGADRSRAGRGSRSLT